MSEEYKRILEAQLWNIAITERVFRLVFWFSKNAEKILMIFYL